MTSQEFTPPVIRSVIPTAKEKKYDRQLRLWAATGQQALEDAKILLLNSNPGVVGVETLKNLVLPGVGSFTIVDGATVSDPDLGLNFFLEESSLGKSRAAETSKYLKELNPHVEFHSVDRSPDEFVQKDSKRLKEYTLVLLIGPCKETRKICSTASESSIPLFYVHSVGFYSHFSVQLPALFPLVDTHPDPASTQDLRLLDPWPELANYQRQQTGDLHLLEDHPHGHVPYVLLLLHYLEEWKRTHDGNPPSNYSEKKEFKTLVSSGARTSPSEGGEENFDEAAAAVLKSLNPPSISSGLREIFQETTWDTLTPMSPNFWWIACAIHDFYKKHNGLLPLPGTLPDMKAQSADYVQLQTIYRKKAADDIAEVTTSIEAHKPQHNIPHSEIAEFCKNAAHVKLIRGRPLALSSDFTSAWDGREKEFTYQLQEEASLLPIYIVFQAYDDYFASLKGSSHHPLLSSNDYDNAFESMTNYSHSTISHLLKAGRVGEDEATAVRERMDSVLKEMHRGFGAELHNIAALTGGMVAQEVIKVITKQYIPIDNTCVFDGVQSKTAVFKVGRAV